MATARIIAVSLAASALGMACDTPCGLQLQQHVYLAPPRIVDGRPVQQDSVLECCGGKVFRDIDVTTKDGIEIDLTNPNGSGVDAFITTVGCDTLFDAPYTGSGTPRCQVYIGPVRPREVSSRQKIAAGRYRVYAQGYAGNAAAMNIALDIGLWSNDCRWTPIAP